LTIFTAPPPGREIVVQPLRAPAADAVVDGLRAIVVERGLPREQAAPCGGSARRHAAMSASPTPAPRAPGATKRSFMTPMRAARVVDHVQKIVAKPIARAALVAGEELHALARRVGDERAAHRSRPRRSGATS
jgi:hypothetical protein